MLGSGASQTMPKLIEPIQRVIEAKPHRPVYRMHRYFARRPYSVFAELVRHYSDPLDVIFDPFCGGGVTLVEGVLQGRRVIGFDTNPLATFVSRTELTIVNLEGLKKAQAQTIAAFRPVCEKLFATICRKCGATTAASWFEYSAVAKCQKCGATFTISTAKKQGIGKWECPSCGKTTHFSSQARTSFTIIDVYYHCDNCGFDEIKPPSSNDLAATDDMERQLEDAEAKGLWIPKEQIPHCNMERESALFKKGIFQFRQFFTPRHLIALGRLRETILEQYSPFEEWLLLAFSSALRYTNRMVTRNPSWRKNRPLEWVKPGYWLPPIHLEANVLQEFARRCEAIIRGKQDYQSRLAGNFPIYCDSAEDVLAKTVSSFHVSTRSSTSLPLPDWSIDVIITDPPYGSYVHYADLGNFWSVWLPETEGMGRLIDTSEEAVMARKSFPGAKGAREYQDILERCFLECARVLKPGGHMVMTFNNREPRAWAALLVATTKAGFELLANGLIYQKGIASYRHTAQSRRQGSIVGDFILTFRKFSSIRSEALDLVEQGRQSTETALVDNVALILRENGPQRPDELIARLYTKFQPILLRKVSAAVATSDAAAEKLIAELDQIKLLDSESRQLLERHFKYEDGKWGLRHDG